MSIDDIIFYSTKQPEKRDAENGQSLKIIGFHVLAVDKEPELEDGIPIFRAGTDVKFRIFGEGFTDETMIGLTTEAWESGQKCHKIASDTVKVSKKKLFRNSH